MTAWRPTEIELVQELAAKGVSAQRIGARIGRTTRAVRNLARELGVPLKSQAELRSSLGLGARFRPSAVLQETHPVSDSGLIHPRSYR